MVNYFAQSYCRNHSIYVFPFEIHEKNGKTRTIITYLKNSVGRSFRRWHEEVLRSLTLLYKSNQHSFAYKKRVSCKSALADHMKSNCFIKLDIHSFFESISYERFLKEGYPLIKKVLEVEELKALFYDSHLSLGYVTSPIISDIYMNSFDEKIEEYIKNKPNLHYSRYCDDILISSEDNDFADLEALQTFIEKELAKKELSINKKKEKKECLNYESHNSFSFLGLNISKKVEGDNKITISKHFILKILDYLEAYYNNYPNCNYVFKMNILSRIAYIKHISSDSYDRFLKKHLNRFKKAYEGI